MNEVKIRAKDGEKIVLNQSKSMIIRQLIASYLYQDQLIDICEDDANDVWLVHAALARIRQNQPSSPSVVEIDVQDCGAAYRFLTAVLSLTSGRWLLTGTERLLQRPIRPLVESLQKIGAQIQTTLKGLLIEGKKLYAEEMTVDCTESSQFASALYLVAPLLGLQKLHILPATPPSAPYIQMTRAIVQNTLNGRVVARESDWSSAAFWYAFLAVSPQHQTLLLLNLRLDSAQGDRIMCKWAEQIGIFSAQTPDGVRIEKKIAPMPSRLEMDFSQNPDLAPIWAVVSVLLKIPLVMCGVDNLDKKESARLSGLKQVLAPVARFQQIAPASVAVFPNSGWKECAGHICFHDLHDHRMVIAYALFSAFIPVHFVDIQCVNKSYPQFLKYLGTPRP